MTALKRLVSYFAELCFLRAAPQDLSASGLMFGLTFGVNLAVTLLLVASTEADRLTALWQSLLDTALMLGALYLVLRAKAWAGRFVQTSTALLGSSALLGLLTLPMVQLGRGPTDSIATVAAAWLLVVVLAWSMLVMGHILRHALELRLGQGVLIAVAFSMVTYVLINAVFPVA